MNERIDYIRNWWTNITRSKKPQDKFLFGAISVLGFMLIISLAGISIFGAIYGVFWLFFEGHWIIGSLLLLTFLSIIGGLAQASHHV